MKPPMNLLARTLFLVITISSTIVDAGSPDVLEKRSISAAVYDDLFFYYKYASSAYLITCAKPNGNTLVSRFDSSFSDTQGFIARDDRKKEIVVSFRGSNSPEDFLIDGLVGLTPFNMTNIPIPPGVMVNEGFYTAWKSVAAEVISNVRKQLSTNPGYSVVTTGHALGGALSSLAGITLKEVLTNTLVRMYTYGQPRTGNKAYADWVDRTFASTNLFR
ncbi:Alpha/Beta hydrolase protein [Collybia nuda]|uniref:Alpha/Beta hydrolase protein n=1 Tax=Collybia nuda TaxID=64659 RepID=A0A9P6CCT9_9AGAR|nr:Alpha/Beta hydrolase protein [Collybia nuda]